MADEFLIHPRWIVPVEPAGVVLQGQAVAVRGGKIEAILPVAQARAQFASRDEIVLGNHILIPGLVNAHTRAALTLLRGAQERVAAAEAKHLSAEFVRDGTQLACAEMALGGITCFNNMYFFPEAALQAAIAIGLRSAQGLAVMDRPSPYASDAQDYLRKGLETRDRHRDQPLASFCLAPATDEVSDEVLGTVATLAAELDIPVHIRLRGTSGEIERLRRLGLLGPGLIAAHGAHLDEIGLLAAHGCSVVRCPTSDLKHARGKTLSAPGLNVALGTDGADASGRLDMFQEMRLAALPAHAALIAATLAGARALGINATTGSIVPGKSADLAAVEMRWPHLVPCHDPVLQLVHAAGREDVSHVWVAGKLLVRGGKLQNEAFPGLDTRMQLWQNALVAAGS